MDKHFGYTGKILRIDLASLVCDELRTVVYADRFIGGRGIVAKLYFDTLSRTASAFDAAAPLLFMTGPLCGTGAIGGSRWFIAGKSPLMYPEQFGLGSGGGAFGCGIKAAGYDGIVVTGKAAKPSLLLVMNGRATVHDAGKLWGQEPQDVLRQLHEHYPDRAQALCIGPAGENRVRLAVAVSDGGSTVGSGFGAVMGAKNLKAIVVQGGGAVRAARPDGLKKTNAHIRALIGDKFLPAPSLEGIELVKRSPCPGCPAGCPRGLYRHDSGREEFLKNCQSAYMYYVWDQQYHQGEPTKNPFLATSLCNRMGLCTQEMSNLLRLINECSKRAIIKDEPDSLSAAQLGSLAFIQDLIEKISRRQGIGDILAEGTIRAAETIGNGAQDIPDCFVTKSGFYANAYNPRYFITSAVLYATESTSPLNHLHEIMFPMMKWVMWHATDGSMSQCSTEVIRNMAKKFWGSADGADFSTSTGKGAIAKIIQDRNFAKENLVVCDFLYPMMTALGSEDQIGNPDLECNLLSAVTGIDYSEQEYYRTGERTYNLQRAIQCLEGRRGRDDDTINEVNFTQGLEEDEGFFGIWNPEFLLPGPDGSIVSRKGAVIDRNEFSAMLDEFYTSRGWDAATGLQPAAKLTALGLDELIPALSKGGLLA